MTEHISVSFSLCIEGETFILELAEEIQTHPVTRLWVFRKDPFEGGIERSWADPTKGVRAYRSG